MGIFLTGTAKKQVTATYIPLRKAIDEAQRAVVGMSALADQKRELDYEAAVKIRKSEIQAAKEKHTPMIAAATRKRDAQIQAIRSEFAKQMAQLEQKRDSGRGDIDEWQRRLLPRLQDRADFSAQRVLNINEDVNREARHKFDEGRMALEQK